MKIYIMVIMVSMLLAGNPSMGSMNEARASEPSFDVQLDTMEERMHLLRMVVKKLKKSFVKAKGDHAFMLKNGMPKEDIDRLESAFQNKLKHMIDAAIADINAI